MDVSRRQAVSGETVSGSTTQNGHPGRPRSSDGTTKGSCIGQPAIRPTIPTRRQADEPPRRVQGRRGRHAGPARAGRGEPEGRRADWFGRRRLFEHRRLPRRTRVPRRQQRLAGRPPGGSAVWAAGHHRFPPFRAIDWGLPLPQHLLQGRPGLQPQRRLLRRSGVQQQSLSEPVGRRCSLMSPLAPHSAQQNVRASDDNWRNGNGGADYGAPVVCALASPRYPARAPAISNPSGASVDRQEFRTKPRKMGRMCR